MVPERVIVPSDDVRVSMRLLMNMSFQHRQRVELPLREIDHRPNEGPAGQARGAQNSSW